MKTVPLCVLSIGLAFAIPASAAFKCTDEKGRTHFEDTLPAACANVVTYELSRSGNVIRKIEPNAPAEGAAKSAEVDKDAVARKRRDTVLLDSYGSEREIDAARDRNVEMLETRLTAARGIAQRVQQREQELQRIWDAKHGAVSDAVSTDLARAKAERATSDASVARLEKDLETTQARFAADKARWVELRATK